LRGFFFRGVTFSRIKQPPLTIIYKMDSDLILFIINVNEIKLVQNTYLTL
jgi:hypothetical protein